MLPLEYTYTEDTYTEDTYTYTEEEHLLPLAYALIEHADLRHAEYSETSSVRPHTLVA